MANELSPDLIENICDLAKVSIDVRFACKVKPKKLKIKFYVQKKLDEIFISRANNMKTSKCEVDFIAKTVKKQKLYRATLHFSVYRFDDYAVYEFTRFHRFEVLPKDDFYEDPVIYDLHTGEQLTLWKDEHEKMEKIIQCEFSD